MKLRVQLNRNGIVEFDSAHLMEEYSEEVPASDKMQEEKTENKTENIKKKTRTTKLTAEVSALGSLNEKQLAAFYEEECQMANQDRVVHETYEKKNELESYIYEMRNKLNDLFGSYVQPQIKDSFLAELERAEAWLYADGFQTTKSVYAQRLAELKQHGDPIVNRYREYEEIPEAYAQFLQNLATYEGIAASNVRERFL